MRQGCWGYLGGLNQGAIANKAPHRIKNEATQSLSSNI